MTPFLIISMSPEPVLAEAIDRPEVLKPLNNHAKGAIAKLSDDQRQLFERLLRAEGDKGPTGGSISSEDLKALMAVDSPLAQVAFLIWAGRIKIGEWERGVGADEFRKEVPDLLIQYPHLREIGYGAYFDGYCYGLTTDDGQKDNIPRAYWAHYMMDKNPDMKDAMIERLKEYESKTYLAKALEDKRFATDAAKALLELPEDPSDLPREMELGDRIIAQFPDSPEALKAQQRIDTLFTSAIEKGVQFKPKFLEQLIYGRPKYQERGFQLALKANASPSDQIALNERLVTDPPTSVIQMKMARHLLSVFANDMHNYWGHMSHCMFIFANLPALREEAFAILRDKAQRHHLMESLRAVPEYATRIMDVIETEDARCLAANKSAESERHSWYPPISSTDVSPYFDGVTAAMNDTVNPEVATRLGGEAEAATLADRLGKYMNASAENEFLVGQGYVQPWRFADVVVQSNVEDATRYVAWQKLSQSEFRRESHSHRSAFLKALGHAAYSDAAAEVLLETFNLFPSELRQIIGHVSALSPEVAQRAGRAIFAHSMSSNEDIDFVAQAIPGLAQEAEKAKRPMYADVVEKLKAAATQPAPVAAA